MNRLVAYRTDGDGDCLTHGTCLAMVGAHDRGLALRQMITQVHFF